MASKMVNGSAAAVSCEIVGAVLTLTFADGSVARLAESSLSESIRHAAIMHGLKQKLVDAAAMSRNPDTGKPASMADKKAAVLEVFERITSPDGTWNKVRGEGGTASEGGLLIRALVRVYDGVNTPEQVRAYVANLDAAQQAALRKDPRIFPIILTIKAEDAARRVEQGEPEEDGKPDLLAGLGAIPGVV